jgi:hypothetical protein
MIFVLDRPFSLTSCESLAISPADGQISTSQKANCPSQSQDGYRVVEAFNQVYNSLLFACDVAAPSLLGNSRNVSDNCLVYRWIHVELLDRILALLFDSVGRKQRRELIFVVQWHWHHLVSVLCHQMSKLAGWELDFGSIFRFPVSFRTFTRKIDTSWTNGREIDINQAKDWGSKDLFWANFFRSWR